MSTYRDHKQLPVNYILLHIPSQASHLVEQYIDNQMS
jgi:hypothetical protein